MKNKHNTSTVKLWIRAVSLVVIISFMGEQALWAGPFDFNSLRPIALEETQNSPKRVSRHRFLKRVGALLVGAAVGLSGDTGIAQEKPAQISQTQQKPLPITDSLRYKLEILRAQTDELKAMLALIDHKAAVAKAIFDKGSLEYLKFKKWQLLAGQRLVYQHQIRITELFEKQARGELDKKVLWKEFKTALDKQFEEEQNYINRNIELVKYMIAIMKDKGKAEEEIERFTTEMVTAQWRVEELKYQRAIYEDLIKLGAPLPLPMSYLPAEGVIDVMTMLGYIPNAEPILEGQGRKDAVERINNNLIEVLKCKQAIIENNIWFWQRRLHRSDRLFERDLITLEQKEKTDLLKGRIDTAREQWESLEALKNTVRKKGLNADELIKVSQEQLAAMEKLQGQVCETTGSILARSQKLNKTNLVTDEALSEDKATNAQAKLGLRQVQYDRETNEALVRAGLLPYSYNMPVSPISSQAINPKWQLYAAHKKRTPSTFEKRWYTEPVLGTTPTVEVGGDRVMAARNIGGGGGGASLSEDIDYMDDTPQVISTIVIARPLGQGRVEETVISAVWLPMGLPYMTTAGGSRAPLSAMVEAWIPGLIKENPLGKALETIRDGFATTDENQDKTIQTEIDTLKETVSLLEEHYERKKALYDKEIIVEEEWNDAKDSHYYAQTLKKRIEMLENLLCVRNAKTKKAGKEAYDKYQSSILAPTENELERVGKRIEFVDGFIKRMKARNKKSPGVFSDNDIKEYEFELTILSCREQELQNTLTLYNLWLSKDQDQEGLSIAPPGPISAGMPSLTHLEKEDPRLRTTAGIIGHSGGVPVFAMGYMDNACLNEDPQFGLTREAFVESIIYTGARQEGTGKLTHVPAEVLRSYSDLRSRRHVYIAVPNTHRPTLLTTRVGKAYIVARKGASTVDPDEQPVLLGRDPKNPDLDIVAQHVYDVVSVDGKNHLVKVGVIVRRAKRPPAGQLNYAFEPDIRDDGRYVETEEGFSYGKFKGDDNIIDELGPGKRKMVRIRKYEDAEGMPTRWELKLLDVEEEPEEQKQPQPKSQELQEGQKTNRHMYGV